MTRQAPNVPLDIGVVSGDATKAVANSAAGAVDAAIGLADNTVAAINKQQKRKIKNAAHNLAEIAIRGKPEQRFTQIEAKSMLGRAQSAAMGVFNEAAAQNIGDDELANNMTAAVRGYTSAASNIAGEDAGKLVGEAMTAASGQIMGNFYAAQTRQMASELQAQSQQFLTDAHTMASNSIANLSVLGGADVADSLEMQFAIARSVASTLPPDQAALAMRDFGRSVAVQTTNEIIAGLSQGTTLEEYEDVVAYAGGGDYVKGLESIDRSLAQRQRQMEAEIEDARRVRYDEAQRYYAENIILGQPTPQEIEQFAYADYADDPEMIQGMIDLAYESNIPQQPQQPPSIDLGNKSYGEVIEMGARREITAQETMALLQQAQTHQVLREAMGSRQFDKFRANIEREFGYADMDTRNGLSAARLEAMNEFMERMRYQHELEAQDGVPFAPDIGLIRNAADIQREYEQSSMLPSYQNDIARRAKSVRGIVKRHLELTDEEIPDHVAESPLFILNLLGSDLIHEMPRGTYQTVLDLYNVMQESAGINGYDLDAQHQRIVDMIGEPGAAKDEKNIR